MDIALNDLIHRDLSKMSHVEKINLIFYLKLHKNFTRQQLLEVEKIEYWFVPDYDALWFKLQFEPDYFIQVKVTGTELIKWRQQTISPIF